MTIDLTRAHPNNPYRQPLFVPRTEIFTEPGYPITGSRWLGFGAGPSKVNHQIVHYAGSLYSGYRLSAAQADVIRRLRESNRSSWNSRGYALYYNFDLPTDGSLYGIREWSIRNAANADDNKLDGNENDWSYAVHCVFNKVNSDQYSNVTVEPTWDQLETLRWLRWEAREYAIAETGDSGFQVGCMPHCDIKPTGCCGDKGIAAIRAGLLDIPARDGGPAPDPVPEVPNPPLPEEDDMSAAIQAIYKPGPQVHAPNPKWFVLRADGGIRHASGPDVAHGRALKVPEYTIEGDEHYAQLDTASQK
jgi:hypothetical protein